MDIMPLVAVEGASSTLTDAVSDALSIFNSVSSVILSNPIAMAFVGMALAGGAIGLFGGLIHVGRRR